MRLAYSISGYKQPRQFAWLLAALWHPDDLFAVHVDARTREADFQAFRAVAGGKSNVFFIERERIVWMGMGLVRAELRAIRRLLDEAAGFDHLISLSMQCYPLITRAALVAELDSSPGANHIRMLPLAAQSFEVRRRPHLMSFELEDRVLRTPLPRLVPSATPIRFKGSWWRVLSHDFCAWLVEAPITRRYLAFLEHVRAPDEFLFQNLIMESPYKDTLADDYRHHVSWSVTGGSPDVLTMADFDTLDRSPMWFARKVDETVDKALLERLAQRIGASAPATDTAGGRTGVTA